MKATVNFITGLLERAKPAVDEQTLDVFTANLRDILTSHYKQHWFPERPCKGSGYRCVRLNHKMDPLIAKAGLAAGLSEDILKTTLPQELTVWCDPGEVSFRIGENGSVCVIYEHKGNVLKKVPSASKLKFPAPYTLLPSDLSRYIGFTAYVAA